MRSVLTIVLVVSLSACVAGPRGTYVTPADLADFEEQPAFDSGPSASAKQEEESLARSREFDTRHRGLRCGVKRSSLIWARAKPP